VEPGTGSTLPDRAAAVTRALDAAGVERAHLVGHAFGNRVRRCVAAGHPARVQHAASSATPVDEWWTAGTTAPVLVVQGLDDRMAPPANGRALVDEIGPRARLLELAGMGHAMLPERPDDLAPALFTFVDEVER
jgi:pimeloyl-ACP methyl ester carboxylesterase